MRPHPRPKVLFVAPEAAPFAKTGGLADVVGALPRALRKLGLDVRLVLPFYRCVREAGYTPRLILKDLEIPLGPERLKIEVWGSLARGRIPSYFIAREDMYDRPNLYGDASGAYYDNLERFSCFAHAALKMLTVLPFKADLIHCHDWQTGLVPALLEGPYRNARDLAGTQTVFTVHNLGYQGLFPAHKLSLTGLAEKEFFHMEGLEYWGKMSLLKSGIVYAQAVTTVSPTYAREIQTPEYGMGMEGILRRRRSSLYGILNGVDYEVWDPAKDPHLRANYSRDHTAGKLHCKKALIRELGLSPALQDKPLLGMVSRLDAQKGLDLLLEALDELLALDSGIVILGKGDGRIQDEIEQAARARPGRIGLRLDFDEPLAHRILSGADILLIPSRYEPCGLTQIYAMRYGTVPVVRATGGLEDTVEHFDPTRGTGNGFKFRAYGPDALSAAVHEAVRIFQNPEAWRKVMDNGMKADFSWERSAKNYVKIYTRIVGEGLPDSETMSPLHAEDKDS